MLAVLAKRGVESSVERVFKAFGGRLDELSFQWVGNTAGVIHEQTFGGMKVTVRFPALIDTADVSNSRFQDLVGYAIHELGHVWFTDNEPWDRARTKHGAFLSSIINGLEDPRIEQCVMDSGNAPNSRVLFETLLNNVLLEDGYVKPDDYKNIPFMLAVEGRRLNGYHVSFPSILDASPYGDLLRDALVKAKQASNTAEIVKIAIKLLRALEQRKQEQERKGKQGEQGEQGEQGDAPIGQDGDGQPGQPGEKQEGEDEAGQGRGKAPRAVEPGDALAEQMEGEGITPPPQSMESRKPAVGKPIVEEFTWE